MLARMSSYASAPFENLVATLPMRVGPGTTILALSSRDPRAVLGSERRLAASGYSVTHVAYGPQRAAWAAMARSVGISAMTAGLDGDWRTSGALELAS